MFGRALRSGFRSSIKTGTPARLGRVTVPLAATTVLADGIWTYFTRPEAIYKDGWYYFGWCNSSGQAGVTRCQVVAGSVTSLESVTLATLGEVDDHDNASVMFTPSGALVAFYSTHNSTVIRYRVLANLANFATLGGSGWSAEQQRGTGPGYSYQTPVLLSQDTSRQWLFFRRWMTGTGGARRALSWWTVTNWATVPASFAASYVEVLTTNIDNAWPYYQLRSNGVDRVDVITTDVPQNVGQSSVFHFYMKLNGSNVMKYYQTDGTEITASLPFTTAECTPVYDGSSVRAWVSDVILAPDGHPRLLWPKYVNNTNGNAIEYWLSRWTGSAWTNSKICDSGPGFGPSPYWYHRGFEFNPNNAAKIILAREIDGIGTLEEWESADGCQTYAHARTIRSTASGATADIQRPVGVVGSPGTQGDLNYLWQEGPFTDFNDYDTSLVGSA